jgi:hypothetical protein
MLLRDSYGWIIWHKALKIIMLGEAEGALGCGAAAITTKVGMCNLVVICKFYA